ncbi:hypothetical protein [Thermosipho sp. (in: thermotogales)]|jgi:hypothetical protein|uniref:hypothetical protein n=1 Tax=Thermosipho sp. (in: thermotogales) TaxID=1968895 RepID=UPI00257DB108|nr:hypothetical protein [Thermosipho sp. (in: thermotogales)]MBZ4649217.1 hypothetical protein [Thermosipho sp. (in: thermotogales)]
MTGSEAIEAFKNEIQDMKKNEKHISRKKLIEIWKTKYFPKIKSDMNYIYCPICGCSLDWAWCPSCNEYV